MGKLRVYCLKTLNKLSIYPLSNTPSAPSVRHWLVKDLTTRTTWECGINGWSWNNDWNICWAFWRSLLRDAWLSISFKVRHVIQRFIGVFKLRFGSINLGRMTSVFLWLESSEPTTWEVTSTRVQKHNLSTMLSKQADNDSFSNSKALALNSDRSIHSFKASMLARCRLTQRKNLSCSLLTYASLARLLSTIASAYALTSAKSFFIWFCSCSNLSPWEVTTVQLSQWNEERRLTLVLSPAKSPQSLPTSTAEYLMDRVNPFQGLSTVSASTTPWHNNVHHEAIQECSPSPKPDARVDHRVSPLLPNGDTNYHTSAQGPPTTRTLVRLINPNLYKTLPVDSTGNVVHRWCAYGSGHPHERFGAPWSIQKHSYWRET